MAILASLKGYKTLIVNVIIAIIGILIATGVVPAVEALTAEEVSTHVEALFGAFAVIGAVINIFMRMFTSTPIGQKG
jgi:fumarate reductase subunit D